MTRKQKFPLTVEVTSISFAFLRFLQYLVNKILQHNGGNNLSFNITLTRDNWLFRKMEKFPLEKIFESSFKHKTEISVVSIFTVVCKIVN